MPRLFLLLLLLAVSAPTAGRRWASIKQVAAYVGIGEKTVRDKIANGLFTAYRNGGIIRLDLDEIDRSMVRVGGEA